MPPKRRRPTFAALAAQAKISESSHDRWRVAYFKRHKDDDPDEATPAREYLRTVPPAVAAFFQAVVVEVAAAPPTKFAGGGYWEAMHGDMTGYFEVRKKYRGMHYRLFCRLDEDAEGAAPLLTLVCGMTKPDRTTFEASDYAAVRALGDEYLARNPRSLA